MQKIPTLFVRDPDNLKLVTREVTPGCEWVLAGEGRATQKWDGTCCLVRDGKLYKRIEWREGKPKPEGWFPALADAMPEGKTLLVFTPSPGGKVPGWVPVGDGPDDKWHREAWEGARAYLENSEAGAGTYELCGPKIQGNPEGFDRHMFRRHGEELVADFLDGATAFNAIRNVLSRHEIEGIVWCHPDGRLAKIKRRDFGLPWPVKK